MTVSQEYMKTLINNPANQELDPPKLPPIPSSFYTQHFSAETIETLSRLPQYDVISVFLFGSRARGEHKPSSQTELGLFFRDDIPPSKGYFDRLVSPPNDVELFPYKFADFKNETLIIPFQRQLYLYEVISQGVTLQGQELLGTCAPPKVTNLHLSQDIKFWQGRASDALVCHRANSTQLASVLFSKSMIAGIRDLMILERRCFPNRRSEIIQWAMEIDDSTMVDLLTKAESARDGEEVPFDTLLQGVHFLTQVVETKILDSLSKGEVVLLG